MPKISSFFDRFKKRRLQVDILTVFLFLVGASSLFIILFTYKENSKSILSFSKTTIDRSSALILEKINDLIEDVQQPPKSTAGLFLNEIDISPANKVLASFMLNSLKAHPKVTAFYVGIPDGSMIEVISLALAGQTHYLFDPSKPLPPEARYALRYVLHSTTPSVENWYYKNDNLETISTESISPSPFDSRTRPWYIGAKQTKDLFWTNVYVYDPSKELGITVAKPLYYSSGQFMGVIGSDLSLESFSAFLTEQQIGKTGKAFILSKNTGKILIPLLKSNDEDFSHIPQQLVTDVYNHYSQDQNSSFVIEYNEIQYLASVNAFPIAFNNEWLIVIIAPLKDFFSELLRTQKQVFIISVCIFILAGLLVVYFAKRISAPIAILAKEVNKIQQLELDSTVRVTSNIKEISTMDSSIASMRTAIRSFGRYVPKEIVKQLIQKGQEITLGGEKKEITIVFSDIVGFTSVVESLSTDIVMPLLSEYFDALSKIIIECQGTIDKYIGDSIMSFWGAPQEIADHSTKACTAALLCQAHLLKLNRERREKGLPEFITRFGIDTGMVIVGNIGTSERINYTVIGDAVNTASRLQLVNNVYHTGIIISEDVQKQIGVKFLTRPLDIVTVKGKHEKIKIYELIAQKQGSAEILPKAEEILLCESFAKAYEAFHRGEIKIAKQLFEAIHEKFPMDQPTIFYLQRIASS